MTALSAVDFVHRHISYRVREDLRQQGGRVTHLSPTSMPMECSGCGKAVRHGAPLVLASIYGMHPACAIHHGLLTAIPEAVS